MTCPCGVMGVCGPAAPVRPARLATRVPMNCIRTFSMAASAAFLSACGGGSPPVLPGIRAAMEEQIRTAEIPGAVTMVVARDRTLHLDAVGSAGVDASRPMAPDTIFWIASMTKPVTAVAVLMLQDEGRLHLDDPVAKHLPEFAALKTPTGKPAGITLRQILTHTSGLGEAPREEIFKCHTLAELIPLYVAAPMQFEPGTEWRYCQSGINTAARIVEIVSGRPFEVFLDEQLFTPLGMRDTTFYPRPDQQDRLVGNAGRNAATGALEPRPLHYDPTRRDRPPLGNGGLFSTAPDYARFCQMLLNRGSLDGRQYLRPETVELMTSIQTGDLAAGFVPGSAWGVGTGIVREPQGITAMLSPGTFGHGGRDGTQAWIDPVRGVAYILMIQRDDLENSDGSGVRLAFQTAAAVALATR